MLLCDDIRQELGNKLSFLGVIGIENSGIVFEKLPATLPRLCLALMLSETQTLIEEIDVTIKTPNSKRISTQITGSNIPKVVLGGNVTLGLFMQPFNVASSGDANLELRFNGEKKPSLKFNFKIIEKASPEIK